MHQPPPPTVDIIINIHFYGGHISLVTHDHKVTPSHLLPHRITYERLGNYHRCPIPWGKSECFNNASNYKRRESIVPWSLGEWNGRTMHRVRAENEPLYNHFIRLHRDMGLSIIYNIFSEITSKFEYRLILWNFYSLLSKLNYISTTLYDYKFEMYKEHL